MKTFAAATNSVRVKAGADIHHKTADRGRSNRQGYPVTLRVTPAVLDEIEPAIADALANKNNNDPSDETYRKIHQARQQANSLRRGVMVSLNERDVAELKSRADYNVGPAGVCQENLGWSSDPADRGYWLGRMRAYKALLAQIAAIG